MLSKKFPFPIVKDGLLLVCLFNCLCCYNFIYRGGNLEVLRVLMGHANINITQIYIHLAEQKDN